MPPSLAARLIGETMTASAGVTRTDTGGTVTRQKLEFGFDAAILWFSVTLPTATPCTVTCCVRLRLGPKVTGLGLTVTRPPRPVGVTVTFDVGSVVVVSV